MATKFTRTDDGIYMIHDTATGTVQTFDSEGLFTLEALRLICASTERVEEGLARLEEHYRLSPIRRGIGQCEAQASEIRDTLAGMVAL